MAQKRTRKNASPEELAEAQQRYEAGEPAAAIGRACGRNRSTINTWAREHGWQRPNGFDATTTDAARAVRDALDLDRWNDAANRTATNVDQLIERITEAIQARDHIAANAWSKALATNLDKVFDLTDRIASKGQTINPATATPEQILQSAEALVRSLAPLDEHTPDETDDDVDPSVEAPSQIDRKGAI
ncbi:MAG: helix-turn-helix domain-containing protein [Acidimicrobiales bacterium]